MFNPFSSKCSSLLGWRRSLLVSKWAIEPWIGPGFPFQMKVFLLMYGPCSFKPTLPKTKDLLLVLLYYPLLSFKTSTKKRRRVEEVACWNLGLETEEKFIQDRILPAYGNTHTLSTATARQSTFFRCLELLRALVQRLWRMVPTEIPEECE